MLSLYIHIPFCVSKCRYCGFYSTQYSRPRADQYLAAIGLEIDGHRELLRDREFGTVYFGGGTPTALSAEQFTTLIALLKARLRIAPDAEVTVEANPSTVTGEGLVRLRAQGVTRISLGVQSFSDELLGFLGRTHTAGQSVAALNRAREAGFEHISVDLIYGIPGQTDVQWRQTLETAIALKPDHVAAYALSLDEGSRMAGEVAAGKIDLPGDDAVALLYRTAVDRLCQAGYRQYELSNFSLHGGRCRHNMNYWDRGEYLGLGPGAWSFIGGRRYATIADVEGYCSRLQRGIGTVVFEEVLDREQAAVETLVLGLRKTDGVALDRYRMLAGDRALDALKERIRELDGASLLRIDDGMLRLTGKGRLVSSEVLARVIP